MAYLFSFGVEDDEYEEDNVRLVGTEVGAVEAGCHRVEGHVVAGAPSSSFEAHFDGSQLKLNTLFDVRVHTTS